jgi:hypothetical protein
LTQGEFLIRSGQSEKGRATLREALARLQADPNPDAWPLAAELAGRMREFDEAYAGSHYAVARAAEQSADDATARQEYKAAIKGWEGAARVFRDLSDARLRLIQFNWSSGEGNRRFEMIWWADTSRRGTPAFTTEGAKTRAC